jgi:hypothetical protein
MNWTMIRFPVAINSLRSRAKLFLSFCISLNRDDALCIFLTGSLSVQLAAVAALCVQYEADFRPNMTIVVKALQPLVIARPAGDH